MTDRAETLVLNLARGAGLGGLGAMPPVQPWTKPAGSPRRIELQGLLVRPLLHIERHDARALAGRLGLPFVDDPSNDADDHPRVHVRRRVLPELRALNHRAVAHLAQAAAIAHDAAAVLDGGPITDDVATLRALPVARRRAAILALCRTAAIPRDAVAARTLDAIVGALANDGVHRWDLRGAVLRLEGGRVWIDENAPAAPMASAQPLTHPSGAAILRKPGQLA